MSVAQEKFSYQFPEEQHIEKQQPRRQLSRRAIRRGKIVLTGCILSLFIVGVAVAYYFAQVAAVGYQLSQLQSELTKLQTEQDYLESQANQLLSLQRIEAIATTELGMVKPDPSDVVLVAALPKTTQEQKESQVQQKQEQANRAIADVPEKDNHDKVVTEKSPVIEAFVDLVDRWEQKL